MGNGWNIVRAGFFQQFSSSKHFEPGAAMFWVITLSASVIRKPESASPRAEIWAEVIYTAFGSFSQPVDEYTHHAEWCNWPDSVTGRARRWCNGGRDANTEEERCGQKWHGADAVSLAAGNSVMRSFRSLYTADITPRKALSLFGLPTN